MTIQQLVENKSTLDYKELCNTLINIFCAGETMNWESILPAQQQQEYFGGETLRLIADHPILSKQKDIRPIALKRGSISQMLFFYVTLKEDNLTKKNIQEVTKKFISGGDANRYIIWFFGNTKNTELKVVLSAKEGKKIVLKTLPFAAEQPYYKTYNFILNEVSQQVNKLFVEPTDLWKALWKAFDISIVNRNFYNEIKAVFDSLIQTELPKAPQLFKTEEIKVQFAIRLIGRLIFCWFLKRKGIIKDDVLSSTAVNSSAFGGGTEGVSYYHNLLEILFFDVFNTPDKERKAGLPKIIAHYPFLNGGLFEAQDNDFKDNLLLNIDNSWFYNLFAKTLERYNFTVDENSSSNAEIAIDPEMLGRIFENLLAEQNPETGDSARKATGSFYTPREIVDYMVEQSISEYLKTSLSADEVIEPPLKQNLFGTIPNQQLQIPQVKKGVKSFSLANSAAAIEEFVHTQTLPASLEKYETEISNALATIKVLDPACGSGAFPIGVLQKIVALKQQLHPKTKNYKLKLDTIQNSIYGVDIQPMAVELSRLRCWLSLVVDEEATDIKALPNLDFKFVCADTLMDLPDDKYVKNLAAQTLIDFEEATANYFNPDFKKKKDLKSNIKKALYEITQIHENAISSVIKKLNQERNSSTPTRVKQLEKSLQEYTNQQATWHSYKNIFENKKVDFFNLQYFFPAAKKGFDIVIGNPPYITIALGKKQNIFTEQEIEEYKKNFVDVFEYKANLFAFFTSRGKSLLNSNGVLTYIIPNTLLSNSTFSKLRHFLIEKTQLVYLIDLRVKVFEAAETGGNLILGFKNSEYNNLNIKCATLETLDFTEIDKFTETKFSSDFEKNDEYKFRFNQDSSLGFLDELNIGSTVLGKIVTIYQGVITGDNNKFLAKEQLNEVYKPILRGRDIDKYFYRFDSNYILFAKELLWSNTNEELFHANEKLISRQTGDKLIAAYDNQKYFSLDSTHIHVLKDFDFNLKYVLSIFNSNLMQFWYKQTVNEMGRAFAQVKTIYLKKIPIKNVSAAVQENFITLIDYMLFINNNKKTNPPFSKNLVIKSLEDIIDGMVLELYFEEEMKAKKVTIIDLVTAALAKTNNDTIEDSIYNFYTLVSHPDSEIRNRILNFPIASPTILKPILQG